MQTADAETSKGSLTEWAYPFMFFVCAGWAVWHTPNYILDFLPPESESLVDQMTQLAIRKDVTPGLSGLFGGLTDVIDWLALLMLPVFASNQVPLLAQVALLPPWSYPRFSLVVDPCANRSPVTDQSTVFASTSTWLA